VDVLVNDVSSPVPVTAMTVGLLLAFEFTETVPLRTPATAGRKFSVNEHMPPAGIVLPHVSDTEKRSDGEASMEDIATGVSLRLRMLTVPGVP